MNVIFPSNISTCISNITFIECSANRIKPDRIFRFLKTFMQIFYNGTIKFMQTIFIFQSMAFKIYIERFKTFTQKIYEMGIGQIKTITQSIEDLFLFHSHESRYKDSDVPNTNFAYNHPFRKITLLRMDGRFCLICRTWL